LKLPFSNKYIKFIKIQNEQLTKKKIENEEYLKLFESIKPMTDENINSSIRSIRYDNIFNLKEKVDEYFIKHFVDKFKEYIFIIDISKGILALKSENEKCIRLQIEYFILDCFNIGKTEIKLLFRSINHYLKSQEEIDKLKVLNQLVCEIKINTLIKKIALLLIENSKKYVNNETQSQIELKEED